MKQCLDFSDNPDTPGLCSVCGHTRSAHADAAPAAVVIPTGWCLVPEDPTQEMVRAAYQAQPDAINAGFAQAYRDMVAAAPKLPAAPAQDAVACTCSQAGFPSSCYNCDAEASDIVNALRKLYSTHPICAQAANYIERKLRDMATPSEPLQCLRCGTVDAFGPAARSPAEGEPLTTLQQLKASIDTRINDLLCETKTGHDDSAVGINEAWDVVRKACDEYISRASK